MSSTVPMPFHGGCACGGVRYQCSAAPLRMLNCHCRDCQIAGGSAYSPTLILAKSGFHVIQGQARGFARVAESGNVATREFCPDCGTPLFVTNTAWSDIVGLRASSLDNPGLFRPEADVWVRSAQPWDCMDPQLPKYPQGRPRS